MSGGSRTAVLVHGAGHSAAVWRDTQAALLSPSLAVDLPGRSARPADISVVTIDEATDSVAADVDTSVKGDVVLVGHLVAGTVLPAVTARPRSRVHHLVFVAGLSAPHGELPVEVFLPGRAGEIGARLAELSERHERLGRARRQGRNLRADLQDVGACRQQHLTQTERR
jgi:surfactin synthase thioesterase subunit